MRLVFLILVVVGVFIVSLNRGTRETFLMCDEPSCYIQSDPDEEFPFAKGCGRLFKDDDDFPFCKQGLFDDEINFPFEHPTWFDDEGEFPFHDRRCRFGC